jgi:hypothetical protein
MFISMRRNGVSEFRPPTGLLLPQMIYEYGEPRRNDTDRRKPKNSKKSLSQCHLVHHAPNMADRGANYGTLAILDILRMTAKGGNACLEVFPTISSRAPCSSEETRVWRMDHVVVTTVRSNH